MMELHELTWSIIPSTVVAGGFYRAWSEAEARAYLAGLLTGATLDADSATSHVDIAASITRGTTAPVLIQRWDGSLPDVRDAVTGR